MDYNNNEGSITTTPHNLVKILILQRRSDVISAIEAYNKIKFQARRRSELSTHDLRATLTSLYYEIEAILRRTDRKKADLIYKALSNPAAQYAKLIRVYQYLNKFLDDKELIRIDTKKSYDRTSIEQENQEELS